MGVGIGAVGASLLIANLRHDRTKGKWLFITGIASGLAPIGLGLTPLYSLALPLAIMVGASQTAFMSLTNAFIMGSVPDSVRGRMSSLSLMHAGGMMGFANLLNGQIADHYGATLVFVITGIVYLAVLAFMLQLGGALRAVFTTGTMSLEPRGSSSNLTPK
jgi:MFS family permease